MQLSHMLQLTALAPLAPLALVATALAPAAGAQCVHQESDALVMFEVESVSPVGDWVEETAVSGFSGSSYFRWNGPDFFDVPGNGVLTYEFEIFDPGTYNLRIRNYHDDPDSTLENDVWVRVDGGEWLKVFSSVINTWTFQSVYDLEGGSQPAAEVTLGAGAHTLQLSGRSRDFRIDRVHLFKWSTGGDPFNPFQAESPCAGAGIGTPFCFGSGCPCGNDSPGSGCVNSTGAGATLAASGSTSTSADDLVLTASGFPVANSGLFFMGDSSFAPVNVGDGLACTGGLFRFLPSNVNGAGELSLTNVASVAPAGQITPGDTRYFQGWTRDVLCGPPPAPCPSPCMNGSNLSSGLEVTFTP